MTLQEAVFQRLLPRYERSSSDEPPFTGATVEEAIAHMREQLKPAKPTDECTTH